MVQAAVLCGFGRLKVGQPGRCKSKRARRSSSHNDAARICRIASAPDGLFQNISVPLARKLISLIADSIQALVVGNPCLRY